MLLTKNILHLKDLCVSEGEKKKIKLCAAACKQSDSFGSQGSLWSTCRWPQKINEIFKECVGGIFLRRCAPL